MHDLPNIAFLDFEASSLGKEGYPIEIAWVLVGGQEESHLIRPDPSWTDWDEEAERIHGITRERLLTEGRTVEDVAQRMMAALVGHSLYATAPSWDGKWLSKLLRAAGLPRHALRIEDTELAHQRVVQDILCAANVPDHLQAGATRDIIAYAEREDTARGPAEHRALADARRERDLWLDIRRRATEIAARLRQ
ncbi:transcriptional regulator [Microvirga zambiensis]|uniref:3'-5' exonuclease n=1 Tax=Microvirga zambiensis TaxID=1402137 RepID=UPI00191DA75C|nr:transcriptional regulator [Microvirga zambiensis]